MNKVTKSIDLGGKELTLETGHLAFRANGAVVVKYGETVLLATAVSNFNANPKRGFMPLTVDFIEKFYASGKIPGGFYKREGKPSTNATLSARMVDRTLRPLFDEGFAQDTHVILNILSYDGESNVAMLGIIGAATALLISDIPFRKPVAAVSLGYEDGFKLSGNDILDLMVSGTKESIAMVECGSTEFDEDTLLKGIEHAHVDIKKIVSLQEDLIKAVGKDKHSFEVAKEEVDGSEVEQHLKACLLEEAHSGKDLALKQIVTNYLSGKKDELEEDAMHAIERQCRISLKSSVREHMLATGKRIDGRDFDEIRKITIDMDVLPMAHGSCVFTRGQTQVIGVTTLGSTDDQQIVDDLDIASKKRFFLHYNFPPFSVGEASFMRGPGRRELGHGNLAERAIEPLLPTEDKFPYTMRIVSDVLSSNGSSSMASVCAASLSLMSTGVPIEKHVAGIAMGLVKTDDKYAILTDILGFEDGIGDMDFKVAGTKDGITALQMDIKIDGISTELMREALGKAKEARMFLINKMEQAMPKTRDELPENVPRHGLAVIKTSSIAALIGPSGKNIKAIIEQTGSKIDITDDGKVNIFALNEEKLAETLKLVGDSTKSATIGDVVEGKIKKIIGSGVFIELYKGVDGFLHVSKIADEFVKNIEDHVSEGDIMKVEIEDIDDRSGKIRLRRVK